MGERELTDTSQQRSGVRAKEVEIPTLLRRLDEQKKQIDDITKSQQQAAEGITSLKAQIAATEEDLKQFASFNAAFSKLDQLLKDRIKAISNLQKTAQATFNGANALMFRMDQLKPAFYKADSPETLPWEERDRGFLDLCSIGVANNMRSEWIVDVMSFVASGYSPVPGWVSSKIKEVRAKYDTLKA